jgi:hypothetical protein
MTRGNPRPGQQRMPDQSDEVERRALKAKAATTKATGEIRKAADEVLEEARTAAKKDDDKQVTKPGKQAAREGK